VSLPLNGREHREVAVVGGGPAGAAVAARLASAGRDVLLLERAPAWRWRACGVFASPAAVVELRRLGVDAATIRKAARPIAAMRVEAPGAPPVRLTYGVDGHGAPGDDDAEDPGSAVGFDRCILDEALLGLAQAAGAEVRRASAVRSAVPGTVTLDDGTEIDARMVVGADGIRSVVARSVGVDRPPRLRRVGLTCHVPRPTNWGPEARMVVLSGGYCGLAPVPGDRLNVGLVLDARWSARLRGGGAAATLLATLTSLGPIRTEICDRVAGAWPVGHRVTQRAGPGWLLVGDAAGFLDPFTGEGLHRALVSARLAAEAVERGDPAAYERGMRARFAAKDALSLVVQAFLGRPSLFAYACRRLAARDRVRETMGGVMGDLLPATRALDPRFLTALLAP
jgi:flavin-dependent dehydrogenase